MQREDIGMGKVALENEAPVLIGFEDGDGPTAVLGRIDMGSTGRDRLALLEKDDICFTEINLNLCAVCRKFDTVCLKNDKNDTSFIFIHL